MLFACAIIAAGSLSSCLGGDSDDYTYVPLTPTQKATMLMNMLGSKTGKAYLYNGDGSKAIDSADVSVYVGLDSTVTISNFPDSLLTTNVADKDLKDKLDQTTSTFTGELHLYKPYGLDESYLNLYYYFSIWPWEKANDQNWTVSMPVNEEQETISMILPSKYMSGLGQYALNGYVVSKNLMQFFFCPDEVKLSDGTNLNFQNGTGTRYICISVKK